VLGDSNRADRANRLARHKETNLHYNYFRDYDVALGRYIQSDPIGLLGGMNTYLYALAQPVSRSDALGLSPFSRRFQELFSDFFYGEAAKAMSGAKQFGVAVGLNICRLTGGNIPDPFTRCGAECGKYNSPAAGPAAYDLFIECVKACEEEIKKCKAQPKKTSFSPADSPTSVCN